MKERIIDGNRIHFANIQGSPGNKVLYTEKFFHSDIHHHFLSFQ